MSPEHRHHNGIHEAKREADQAGADLKAISDDSAHAETETTVRYVPEVSEAHGGHGRGAKPEACSGGSGEAHRRQFTVLTAWDEDA